MRELSRLPPRDQLAAWATANYQVMVREMIPGPIMSDEARALFESKLVEIAQQVGPERFLQTLDTIIETCDRRPTIAMIRKLAGIQRVEPRPPFVSAWTLVTKIVARHVRQHSDTGQLLHEYVYMERGKLVRDPVPEIPPAVQSAVDAMGGWSNLAESYPTWWGAKLTMFKELYDPNEQANG